MQQSLRSSRTKVSSHFIHDRSLSVCLLPSGTPRTIQPFNRMEDIKNANLVLRRTFVYERKFGADLQKYCETYGKSHSLFGYSLGFRYGRRIQIICSEKEKTVSLLRLHHGHNEDDALYQLAWNGYQDIQGTLQQVVNGFDSLPCSIPGYLIQETPKNTLISTPPLSPTRRSNQQKMKDEEDYKFPPIRKTAKVTLLSKQIPGLQTPPITHGSTSNVTANQHTRQTNTTVPPPLKLKVTEHYRVHVDAIKKAHPTLRFKTTGEFIKLYTNDFEQYREVMHAQHH
ncbi:hypothetical protein TNCT_450221 [Trichonephila clavata]|uniref:Uncharacterized protein n=1 Tax=Trichonephila clavata TaxID=2740835 RepID=A0A8X6F6W7_TRICU|nr:hypothetical protein TNCT_450221 [Trichonephila clavata]